MAGEQRNKSLFSSFMAIGSGTIINMLLGLLTTPLITRLVLPAEYGRLSIFNMYTNIALIVLCVGLDQALVRFFYDKGELSQKKGLLQFCFFIPMLVSAVACLGIIGASYLFDNLFGFNQVIILFLCLNILVSVWNRFSLLILRLTNRNGLYAIVNIAHKIVYIVIALVFLLIIQDHDLLILVLATVISLIVSSLVASFGAKEYWGFGKAEKLSHKKSVFYYGLPFILSMGITAIFQACDKIALQQYCTDTDVGIYSSAMNLVAIFAIIQTAFNAVWAPKLVEILTLKPEDKTTIQKANKYITVVMFGFGFCLILIKDVFALLLGAEYREAAYMLPFLIFNPIMYTISETTIAGIQYSKKSYWNVVVALVPCILNIVGNALLVPRLGGRGAAISTGCAYICFFLMRTLISNRYYPVKYQLWKFIIVTVLAVWYALYNTFHAFGLGAILGFVVVMAALVALYFRDIIDLCKMSIQQIKAMLCRKKTNTSSDK